MTIIVTSQLRAKLDSIRNSCDVLVKHSKQSAWTKRGHFQRPIHVYMQCGFKSLLKFLLLVVELWSCSDIWQNSNLTVIQQIQYLIQCLISMFECVFYLYWPEITFHAKRHLDRDLDGCDWVTISMIQLMSQNLISLNAQPIPASILKYLGRS